MEAMKEMPDKAFDLAIVDPPYGIGMDGSKESFRKNGTLLRKKHEFKGWDSHIPEPEYFKELFRVSINQIIWGANYFVQYLNPSKGWIFWYKEQTGLTMSDGELAFSSYNKPTRIKGIHRGDVWRENTIHPTQKPVRLYKWLLTNYAKPNDRILDTHLGSGSIAIACWDMGFDLTGYEIDKEYFEAAKARLERHKAQGQLF
jgi:site-specific DNA-methyltransferase (adenine-specific)